MANKLKINEFLHGGDYNPDQWLDEPEIIENDFKLFRNAKINSLTLGIFAWDKLEPEEGKFDFSWLDEIFDKIESQNGYVILATPSGARPRWMAEKYPEILRVNEDGKRILFGERHNHCYTSPIYRKKVQIMNQKLAEHFGKRKSLVLWHISNEFGGACYCDLCQKEFRMWLKKKYGTLDALNHAYWSGFWSHEYTDWNQIHSPSPNGDENVMGLNLDWKRFVTERTINFYENEIQPLRKLTPNIPITTNFMGGNPPDSHVFYDLNYWEFAKHVDVVSWDSYPNWSNDYESTQHLAMKTALMNDMMRSLKHDNYLIMENTPSKVNWHPVNRAKRPGMHEMSSLQEIAHGSNSINYFQLHESRGASEMFHGAVISNQNGDNTRTYKDVQKVGEDLQKLTPILESHYQQAKVAIVFDYENMWALDDARTYSNETKKYWETIQKHYQFFWEHDIPVEIINVDDDLKNYKLVIDPMHFLMESKFMNKLENYVENGGILVGTYICGIVDQNFLAHINGWPKQLQKIYGIKFKETDTLYKNQSNQLTFNGEKFNVHDYCDIVENISANVLANYQKDFYKGTPAITENYLGQGKAYYLACRTDNEFLDKFYEMVIRELNLQNNLPIKKKDSKVSVQVREKNGNKYYFVINFSHEKEKVHFDTTMKNILTDKVTGSDEILMAYGVGVYQEYRG